MWGDSLGFTRSGKRRIQSLIQEAGNQERAGAASGSLGNPEVTGMLSLSALSWEEAFRPSAQTAFPPFPRPAPLHSHSTPVLAVWAFLSAHN